MINAAQHDLAGAGAALPARYKMQLVPAREIATLLQPWSALFDACAEANPFYGPDYLMPLAEGPMMGVDWRACVVWRRDDLHKENMAAFMPLAPWRGFLSPLRALRHPYMVGGAPLLDAADPVAAAEAMLDGLCEHYRRPIVIFDDLRLDWPAAKALLAASERSGRPALMLDVQSRPGVTPGVGESEIPPSVAKNLRRRRKRLAEAGDWSIESLPGGTCDARVLEDFLALEAAGWKGARKTALASNPVSLEFARRAFAKDNLRPALRFETLIHNGKTIAANVHLVTSDHAAAVKAAYDESCAAFSPGLLLDAAASETLKRENWTPLLDSVTQPGHPLEKLWRAPVRTGSIALAVDRRKAGAEFEMQVGMERLRRRGRELAKDVFNRLR
ncbi:MAG: GNAT family N-acetyltransferase [Beijerinckiaceae bacterium]